MLADWLFVLRLAIFMRKNGLIKDIKWLIWKTENNLLILPQKRISMLFDREIFVLYHVLFYISPVTKSKDEKFRKQLLYLSNESCEVTSIQPNNGSMIKMLTLAMHIQNSFQWTTLVYTRVCGSITTPTTYIATMNLF